MLLLLLHVEPVVVLQFILLHCTLLLHPPRVHHHHWGGEHSGGCPLHRVGVRRVEGKSPALRVFERGARQPDLRNAVALMNVRLFIDCLKFVYLLAPVIMFTYFH